MYRHITNAKIRNRRRGRRSVRRVIKNIFHEIELDSSIIYQDEFNNSHDNWEQIRLK